MKKLKFYTIEWLHVLFFFTNEKYILEKKNQTRYTVSQIDIILYIQNKIMRINKAISEKTKEYNEKQILALLAYITVKFNFFFIQKLKNYIINK